ncbi:response regulator transcription factor [Nocardia sp. 2]|uniref:Response regulator transcription factor n=1 Tax=Nocardia acididurans TaxID=2802282 RepID=A0ABS1MHG6_9NOCA|nr:response regulator transcription factor [Nocardia acididurans]MBL1080024.1 response regulator transcription factor [Nocardia acididurans]
MELFLLTTDPNPVGVLPSLALLMHDIHQVEPADAAQLQDSAAAVALVDARTDLAAARSLCRRLDAIRSSVPVAAVLTEGGLIAVDSSWGINDILLPHIGPAELDTRLRLLVGRTNSTDDPELMNRIALGELIIDESTYTARLRGRPIDLTYTEFELLRYLAQRPGQVFTRAQLLREIWGYEFLGGTRTVDVHVRRLRAKLGVEYESLIGTVRNVGYKAVRPAPPSKPPRGHH